MNIIDECSGQIFTSGIGRSVSFPYHRRHGYIISNQNYSTQESLVLLLRSLLPLSARWASQLTLCMQQIGFTETLVRKPFSAMALASKILYCQAAEHFPPVSLSASPSAFISLLSFISPSFASSSHSSPFPLFPSSDSSSPLLPPTSLLSIPPLLSLSLLLPGKAQPGRDMVLFLSHSGNTPECVAAALQLVARGVAMLTLTGNRGELVEDGHVDAFSDV